MPIREGENPLTSAEGRERNSRGTKAGASKSTASQDNPGPREKQLMEEVLTKENMTKAMKRVEQNQGAAGIDDMTVGELKNYLKKEWLRIRGELLEGRYKPKPVRRAMIPKAGGGERALGIPTVVDRLIQQAIHQVISPIFEKDFSESSYGYRPKRSAQQAVEQARMYVSEGRRWVVDIDLEKFFDRVNHDILMARVARKVKDKRILLLIRRYLQAGIMEDGLTKASKEGTPQGGPLSPLLSNILLDDLDKELESRCHKFCRYADDCNIYVHTQRAGERVKESIAIFLNNRLKLKVNEAKSAVDRPWKRKFLGYTMTMDKKPRLRASEQSIMRFKNTLRAMLRMGRGRHIEQLVREELNPVIRGWGNYFSLSRVKKIPEELDFWIRRKLRCILWRQMKRTKTRARRMMNRGLKEAQSWVSASNGRGPWWNAGAPHMNEAYPVSYFNKLGLVSLTAKLVNS
ncbi:MAG: group II intron reverse transcriptase/maturase [Candidatus Omnitrophota bacterium]|nr:group II intron reverse transcriptase/maturase [Candidatus Omnitrophota bacterium]